MTRPVFPVEDRRRTHEDPNIPTLTFSAPHHPLFLFRGIDNDSFVSPYETRVSNFCQVPITWRFPRSPVQHFLLTPPVATVPSPLFHYHPVPEPGRGTVQFRARKRTVQALILTSAFHCSAANNNGGERGVPRCRHIWGTAPATQF